MSGRMVKAVNWRKSVYAWLRKRWHTFKEWLWRHIGEPKRPDFNLCKTKQELEKKLDVYVKRSVAWQERERKRLLADGRSGSAARPLWVLLAAVVTLCLLHWAYKSWVDPYQCCTGYLSLADWLDFFKGSTGAILLASPVAYFIWWFRDTNARQQIENQRKDTNLKDFQQLCQWASGEHLKTTPDSPWLPLNTSNPLQVSSAQQLRVYMRGEFGTAFRRPAFEVLITMHGNLSGIVTAASDHKGAPSEAVLTLLHVTSSAMLEARGAFLYEHLFKRSVYVFPRIRLYGDPSSPLLLAGAQWSNFDLNDAGLNHLAMQGVELKGCKFEFARLSHLDMSGASCTECSFERTRFDDAIHAEGAQFASCDFGSAQLFFSTFSFARFHRCRFTSAVIRTPGEQPIAADISCCNFRGAWFLTCNFNKAEFSGNDFTGAEFQNCNFQCTHFRVQAKEYQSPPPSLFQGALFKNCDLSEAIVDELSRFEGATFDAKTKWSEPGEVDSYADMQALTRELAIARGATVLSAADG